MMRATEIVMRILVTFYYDKPLAPSKRGIGAYAAILKDNGVDPELGRFLDDLVRVERNEGIHPEKLLTEVDAELLSTTARSAIIAMIRDMENRDAYLPLTQAAKDFQAQQNLAAAAS
jgi:hypothetical protein